MNARVVDAYLEELLDPGFCADAPKAEPAAEPAVAHAAATMRPAGPAAPALPAEPPIGPARASDDARMNPAPPPGSRAAPAAVSCAASPPAASARPAPASAPPPAAAAPAAAQRWLRLALGGDSYAFELLRVQEVGRTASVVAMRGAPAYVLGAMNLRGRIVPVLDLGLWLGTGAVRPDERARIVVVERDNELIGALVDAVEDVVTLGAEAIEAPLPGGDPGAIVGVARVGPKPTVLLDAAALFG
ncbi:chemotaxis signal transduction protein [Vulcaniibacterium tengchongense]|uniref:Chemotaxis protein CheW n=2 Tax=Vulcaniibacterium tengchongense TaxID=1273429 RepID=A0A3N4W448_9GAMM|nr:chemotaxis protein CheW [Vulcaniibacterium tengchongense]RPE80840.1 chemotaxis signal transduction protein [Vulcaniibacterium tengchongense]